MAKHRKWQGVGSRRVLPIDARAIKKFLEIVAAGWTTHKAANELGIGHARWSQERKRNPHFAKRWEQAEAEGITTLEDAAQKRAVRGVLKPVVSQGRIVTYVREYSDGLLKTALQARSPKYALNNRADATFEESFVGSAESLLAKLDDLFQKLDIKDSERSTEASPVIKR